MVMRNLWAVFCRITLLLFFYPQLFIEFHFFLINNIRNGGYMYLKFPLLYVLSIYSMHAFFKIYLFILIGG